MSAPNARSKVLKWPATSRQRRTLEAKADINSLSKSFKHIQIIQNFEILGFFHQKELVKKMFANPAPDPFGGTEKGVSLPVALVGLVPPEDENSTYFFCFRIGNLEFVAVFL